MSLALTRIQDIIGQSRLDKNEVAPRQFGALDLFINQSRRSDSLIDDETKARVRNSANTTVKFPVLKYNGDVTVANSRSCTIANGESTSAFQPATFVTYFVGVSMVPSLYMNNEIAYMRDLRKKLLDASRALSNAMDQACLAALASAKTQVLNEALGYTFASNTLSVPYLGKDTVLGDLDAMESANGFDAGLNVVGDFAMRANIAKLAQFGPENAMNKRLEYAGKSFWTSKNITKTSGQYSNFYVVPNGQLDLLLRYDREAVLGTRAAGHEWSIGNYLPDFDLPVGLHYYEEVGDQSAIAGDASSDMSCVHTERFGFSLDVAYITAYNSAATTLPSPYIYGSIATGTGNGLPVYVTNTVATKAVQ